MTRPLDKDRLIWLLQEQGGTSNQQVRSVLGLADERYSKLKKELLGESKIEVFRCRGGGIRLTKKGASEKALPDAVSAVDKEKDLYEPFVSALTNEAKENEENALVFDTSALRKSGKWSNPDVTKVAIRTFPNLRIHKVLLTTFELKQWGRWDIKSIFEAASQSRFAHESYVVLEWAKDVPVEGLEEIISVCSRFGVGLITLHPHYNSFRHLVQLEAKVNVPSEDFVEEFLDYVFEKRADSLNEYNQLMSLLKVAPVQG